MLLLFDIDGTLLLKASAEHKAALEEAICAVHRIDLPAGRIETAGRTDGAKFSFGQACNGQSSCFYCGVRWS